MVALGASTFEGRAKRIWEGKKLLELGGVVTKEMMTVKMPLRMRMGVQAKQRRKERQRKESERLEGRVRATAAERFMHGKGPMSAGEKKRRHVRRERRLGGVASLDPSHIRGHIMSIGQRPRRKR